MQKCFVGTGAVFVVEHQPVEPGAARDFSSQCGAEIDERPGQSFAGEDTIVEIIWSAHCAR